MKSWKGLMAAAWVAVVAVGAIAPAAGAQTAADSLRLLAPVSVAVEETYNPGTRAFKVLLRWTEEPDSISAFVHPPDTTGWAVTTPSDQLSIPASRGPYTGSTDRVIAFRALDQGLVGQAATLRIDYSVRREDNLTGRVDVGSGYQPGTWIDLEFEDELTGDEIDFGLQVRFSSGTVDRQGGFLLGVEDFEGFHIWRGIESDGSDLEIIGEVSKEEAFLGSRPGGSAVDSVYFNSVIPTLRSGLPWFSDIGPVDCLGSRIDYPLEEREFFWFDCNTFNGFTYYYAVTTFDRGFEVRSGRQGLRKIDNCQPGLGVTFDCGELLSIVMEVDPQPNVDRIYAVPNPFRTGGSRLTRANYHNFPDNKVRFVNLPERAQLRIYTIAGDLVWETSHNSAAGGNTDWDGVNLSGEEVSSGVYIYKVEADNGDVVYGRLVIIR